MGNKNNNIINICFASDNNYIQHCAAAISSILVNNKSQRKYSFHILDGGITPKNKEKLLSLKNLCDFDMQFYDMSKIDCSELPLNREYISIVTYYRLFLLDILPQNLDKIIYLDCDLVVEKDLAELWEEDIENYIAGVVEDEGSITQSERLKLPMENNYFNAGVIVFNLKKLREFGYKEKCFEYYRKNKDIIILQDQDILNGVFNGLCKYLPLKWNVNGRMFRENELEHHYTLNDENQAKGDIGILHFTDRPKPWNGTCRHPGRNEYFKYLKLTPWKNYRFSFRYIKSLGLNVLRNIFSIENKTFKDGVYKIITVLGMKFKYKKSNINRPKILVHLHIYYTEQIPYMLKQIKNIADCDWDLFVTVSEDKKDSANKILKLKPDAKILTVDNSGYDIVPFIKVLKSIDLSDYDYLLKLHTKGYQKYSKCDAGSGYAWRDVLVESLIGTKKIFKDCLKLFEQSKTIGVIGAKTCILDSNDLYMYNPEDGELYNDVCKQLNVSIPKGHFVAGTMFLCRAFLMEQFKNLDFSKIDLKCEMKTSSGATAIHVLERIICTSVENQGYEIYGVKDKKLFTKRWFCKLLSPIFFFDNYENHKVYRFFGIKISVGRFLKGTYSVKKIKLNIKDINYKNCTAVVFACYTSDGTIPENTIEYLKELKKYSDYIVLVGDCPIFKSETKKIEGIVDSYLFKRHREYDFGSYKRGFNILKKYGILNNIENLILCNDSVVYNGGSLEEFFTNAKKNNFYGLTLNNYGFSQDLVYGEYSPHLQSYLLSISKEIFSAKYFSKFINSIKIQKSKLDVVFCYEMGLSNLIKNKNYSLNSFYPALIDADPSWYYTNKYSNYTGEKLFYKKTFLKNKYHFNYHPEDVQSEL